jgi:hypothetical protein
MNIPAEYIGKPIIEINEILVSKATFIHDEKYSKTEEVVVAYKDKVNIIGFSITGLPNYPVAIFPDKNGMLRCSSIDNFRILQ